MKRILALSIASLALCGLIFPTAAVGAFAEGEEGSVSSEISESPISSEGSAEASEPEDTAEEKPASSYAYVINDAKIGYRDSEDVSYASGDHSIGDYYLSADGWNDGDEYDVVMTVKGNVTTKLSDKVLYLYEYRATAVIWNGEALTVNDDKTYTLKKPSAPGAYDLEINFTKTLISNPTDLSSVNWSSLFTVQNLMTIGSWVVIVVGILVLYALNRRYKKRGSTTLDEVKSSLNSEIENVCGKEMSEALSNLMGGTIKTTFEAIDKKLSTVDNNSAVLMRCLLAMQENTPESRLAVTKLLTELDTSEDKQTEQVRKLIEEEIAKRDSDKEARIKALEEAKKANNAWAEGSASDKTSGSVAEEAETGDDGTSI